MWESADHAVKTVVNGCYERQNRENSFHRPVMSGSGLARSEGGPHQKREIASRRLNEELFVDILLPRT
jgi:hypothetical protein